MRDNCRVVNQAFILATAVNVDGQREVLGFTAGNTEDEETWKEFLRGLVSRGLTGVQLVVSDACLGLKKAVRTVLLGATWQRFMVYFLRNIASKVTRSAQGMVRAAVKNLFLQETKEEAREALRKTGEILPDRRSLICLGGALLAEQHNEWIVARRYMSQHSLAWLYAPPGARLEEGESTKLIA